jgi:hypothetical protein
MEAICKLAATLTGMTGTAMVFAPSASAAAVCYAFAVTGVFLIGAALFAAFGGGR